MTVVILILGILVWLGLGVFGSAIFARYLREEYGNTLGFDETDRNLSLIVSLAGPISILVSLIHVGWRKPMWDWRVRPPQDPAFRHYWEDKRKPLK